MTKTRTEMPTRTGTDATRRRARYRGMAPFRDASGSRAAGHRLATRRLRLLPGERRQGHGVRALAVEADVPLQRLVEDDPAPRLEEVAPDPLALDDVERLGVV